MSKLLVILPFFALIATAFAGLVNHSPCNHLGPGPTPTWVHVDGCDMTSCAVRNGTEAYVRAGFSPTSTHHQLKFDLGLFLVGIPIPVPPPEAGEDACLLLDGGCPLVAGEGERTFFYGFEIVSPIVGPTVLIELNLMDAYTEQSVACAGVTVTISA